MLKEIRTVDAGMGGAEVIKTPEISIESGLHGCVPLPELIKLRV